MRGGALNGGQRDDHCRPEWAHWARGRCRRPRKKLRQELVVQLPLPSASSAFVTFPFRVLLGSPVGTMAVFGTGVFGFLCLVCHDYSVTATRFVDPQYARSACGCW